MFRSPRKECFTVAVFSAFLLVVLFPASAFTVPQRPASVNSVSSPVSLAQSPSPTTAEYTFDSAWSCPLAPFENICYSNMWAGYVIHGEENQPVTYQEVAGKWSVPSVDCSGNSGKQTSVEGTWVGLGGRGPFPLEQIGTFSGCNVGNPVYYSWYEMVPANAVNIPDSNSGDIIQPGDIMQGEVSYAGNGVFYLDIHDYSQGWDFSTYTSGNGSADDNARSSAEWIVEAPNLCHPSTSNQDETCPSLADFGVENFLDCSSDGSTISNGVMIDTFIMTQTGGAANSSNPIKAQPDPLSDTGTGFAVEWESS